MIHAIAVDISQVNQETYTQIGARSAAHGQRQDYFAPNRALAQVNDAGADLGEKVESASEPTARMGGTPKPKMRIGSSRTPPPTPVIPIRVPTPKPTRILISRSMTV